jgi:hypothetical protein
VETLLEVWYRRSVPFDWHIVAIQHHFVFDMAHCLPRDEVGVDFQT